MVCVCAGLKANLKRAWANFPKGDIDDADSKTKSILFGLCYFHAIMMERKLFGESVSEGRPVCAAGYVMMIPQTLSLGGGT